MKAFSDEIERLAKQQRDALMNGQLEDRAKAPLRIFDAHDFVLSKAKRLFPVMTAYAKEVERELERAAAILGSKQTWNALVPRDLQGVYHARVMVLRARGYHGRRGAEITVARLLTVAQWLRENKLILPDACPTPTRWQQRFALKIQEETKVAPMEPHRPRHSQAELIRLLAVAGRVDPRLGSPSNWVLSSGWVRCSACGAPISTSPKASSPCADAARSPERPSG